LHSYAVLRGDQLRLEWAAPASAILSEEKLGSLASVGDHLVRVFRDEKYIFTLRTTFGDERVVLDIVTMDEQMSTIVKPGGRPPLPWKRKRPQQPQQAVRFNLGRWFDRFLNFFTR
jgi:hypothetical protein